ncbi:sm-like ribonucleo protein [Ceraceosorus bombacis]|uniref:Small nuclear ribonucleoprotein E n=2 Tax=Ceraceosorus TaxID=401624 RepID=A0A0P1BFF8_9BASI|nr:Sm-like ribonucleo protein [Ceraceosorus guamensis]PWN40399.1 Sm-like ribonucleo protein [Ceraceosorus guamensis]CEH14952.1 sm-like ribonucleo protein [Ceraceosorus bombacis]
MGSRQQRVMVQPINVIFKFLQQKTRVSIWLYDNLDFKLEGVIIGFDEFMNVTLAEAEEVHIRKEKAGQRAELGRILLKGDNISVLTVAQ